MIDQTAFFSLSYGLYIVGATDGERRAACVANTFQQVTSSPLQVSVALNKENATTDVILDSGRFTVSCLAQDATMELFGTFGFHCSTDLDSSPLARRASTRRACRSWPSSAWRASRCASCRR